MRKGEERGSSVSPNPARKGEKTREETYDRGKKGGEKIHWCAKQKRKRGGGEKRLFSFPGSEEGGKRTVLSRGRRWPKKKRGGAIARKSNLPHREREKGAVPHRQRKKVLKRRDLFP